MYLIGSLALFLITLYISITPNLKKFRQQNKEFLTTAVTFVITFVGVFLGIHFSKIETIEKEEKQIISLISISKGNIDDTLYSIRTSKEHVLKVKHPNGNRAFYGFTRTNPFQTPYIFDKLIESEIVLEKISPYSFEALINAQKNASKIIKYLNNDNSLTDKEYLHRLEILENDLLYISEVLQLEINFQMNKLSPEELLQKINESRMRNLPKKLKKIGNKGSGDNYNS